MEIVFKEGKLVKMFEFIGSSFNGNADLIAALNLIESGPKSYL